MVIIMVKGVSRHAVIVRSPDMKDFEQAIFILSSQADQPQVKTPDEMLSLACSLADGYRAKGRRPARGRFFGYLACFLSGAVAAAAAWWAVATFILQA